MPQTVHKVDKNMKNQMESVHNIELKLVNFAGNVGKQWSPNPGSLHTKWESIPPHIFIYAVSNVIFTQ